MQLVTEALSNGHRVLYQCLENGTHYHSQTPQDLVRVIERARIGKYRVRIFYGDTRTGHDWGEENDVVGHIGRSTGPIQIPILLHNSRSTDGPAISDDCIVKFMIGHQVVYRHPRYNLGRFAIGGSRTKGYRAAVYRDGALVAQFKGYGRARRWVQFMQGKRLAK